jgi:membrane-associated HD superfamily phosphohydrolase
MKQILNAEVVQKKVTGATSPDSYYDETNYAEDKRILEVTRLQGENMSRQQMTNQIFMVAVVWIFIIVIIVVACGSGHLKLSDSVLITLITTTTLNVFGFMVIVVKYLFNTNKSS